MTTLNVFRGTTVAARVSRGQHHHVLTYDPKYLSHSDALPLSYSLPLSDKPIEHKRVDHFLMNALPENEIYLANLKQMHRLKDVTDPIEVLGVIGAEAPGAFQYTTGNTPPSQVGSLERASEQDIEQVLRSLRAHRPRRGDRLSLAGYQPKTSFRRGDDGYWYFANGRAASTHIFKPPPVDEPELDVIEHVMSLTAQNLGIETAQTDVLTFGTQRCFISERYDRVVNDGHVQRLHQEDLMQALGLSRDQKYQKNGGPTVIDLLKFCEHTCPQDTDALLKLIAFNVRCGNTDAHAKNYSFLITHRGHHLAPAYDLLSLIPYGDKYTNELAMSIGSARTAKAVTDSNWTWVANKTHIDPSRVLDAVHFVDDSFADAFEQARNASHVDDPRSGQPGPRPPQPTDLRPEVPFFSG